MKLKTITAIFSASILSLTTGCASLITENTTAISVKTSNGQDAKVFVDGQPYSVPGTIMAKKDGQDKIITVDTEGCTKSKTLPTEIEPAFFGNLIFGGLPGSTTDSATGKMWTYEENVTIACFNS